MAGASRRTGAIDRLNAVDRLADLRGARGQYRPHRLMEGKATWVPLQPTTTDDALRLDGIERTLPDSKWWHLETLSDLACLGEEDFVSTPGTTLRRPWQRDQLSFM
jgi:hypothetical protein